jgi:hypothetical protein
MMDYDTARIFAKLEEMDNGNGVYPFALNMRLLLNTSKQKLKTAKKMDAKGCPAFVEDTERLTMYINNIYELTTHILLNHVDTDGSSALSKSVIYGLYEDLKPFWLGVSRLDVLTPEGAKLDTSVEDQGYNCALLTLQSLAKETAELRSFRGDRDWGVLFKEMLYAKDREIFIRDETQ